MKLIILGSGGHARPVIATAETQNKWVEIYVVDLNFNGKKEVVLGKKIIGPIEILNDIDSTEFELALAIGDNKIRKKVSESKNVAGFNFANIIHKTATIDKSAIMGNGNYVGACAHIGPMVNIGFGNIINTSSNIEHEVCIGSYNQLGPGAIVCGRSQVKNEVFLGANSTVIDSIHIVDGVTVGAGSVILQSITEINSTYIGVPGKMK